MVTLQLASRLVIQLHPTTSMSILTVNALQKEYKTATHTVTAVADLTLTLTEGEFVTILGPSGCGKSTLFRLLTGLEQPDKGEIILRGESLPTAGQRRGRFGYMPQRDALLPWRSVLNNLTLGAQLAGRDMEEARQTAVDLLPLFGLEGFAAAWPATLSGGMRQRAALLRTFLTEQDILLLDEPFGALDAFTRQELQQWLMEVWDQLDKTILFITHDVDEAILLGNRVLVFSPRPGKIAADIAIDLPFPRQADTLLNPDFLRYKRLLMGHLTTT